MKRIKVLVWIDEATEVKKSDWKKLGLKIIEGTFTPKKGKCKK